MFPGWFLDEASLEVVRTLPDSVGWFRNAALEFAGATKALRNRSAPHCSVGIAIHDGDLQFTITEEIKWRGDARYNSALLLDDDGVRARYDKLFLTPFGEVMPYISAWPWLEQQLLKLGAHGMRFDLDAGKGPVRFAVSPGVRVVTPICFEATMPSICRKLVFEDGERQAEVMINMTNDGWFGNSDAGRQLHLLAARWRCVELATPMARSANTGISCLILPDGVVQNRMPVRERGYLVVEAPLGNEVPLFARVGHLVPWIGLLGSIFLVGLTYLQDRRGQIADAGLSITTEGDLP